MNAYDLLDAVNKVDIELIQKAQSEAPAGKTAAKPNRKVDIWIRRGLTAAAAVLLIFFVPVGVKALRRASEEEKAANQASFAASFDLLLRSFQNGEGNFEYPDYFGGAFSDENGILVIQLAKDSDSIREKIRKTMGSNTVEFEKVKYSYTTLLNEYHYWSACMTGERVMNEELKTAVAQIVEVDLICSPQKIVIGLADANDAALQEIIRKYAQEPNLIAFEYAVEPNALIEPAEK